VQYERFEDFVRTPPTAGIGGSMDMVRRIVSADPVTLDLLDRAVQRPVGANQHTVGVDNINSHPTGTSTGAALRRLRKDRPDLHATVLAGEVSAHAAMVEAGFRRKTLNVPLEPLAIARALRRNLAGAQVTELISALIADEPTHTWCQSGATHHHVHAGRDVA
jgi:hypothetical protein